MESERQFRESELQRSRREEQERRQERQGFGRRSSELSRLLGLEESEEW